MASAPTARRRRRSGAPRRGRSPKRARPRPPRPASDGGTPYPLYALGRARAAGGDLPGASRALEAAMVVEPGFVPASLAWAEVRLDAGDAKAARPALESAVARAPGDTRAHLLLEEADVALG